MWRLDVSISGMADDVSSRRREVDRSMDSDMFITQDTIKKRLNIELSTGLNKGDGEYDVIGVEE